MILWNKDIQNNVIAAVIFGILASIGTLIYSYANQISFSIAIIKIFTFKVPLYWFLIFLSAVFLVYKIFKFFAFVDYKKALRNYNKSTDQINEIIQRWDVVFNPFGKPLVANLKAYCNKHTTPLKFVGNNCPDSLCLNHNFNIDLRWSKNHIESELTEMYDNLR
jgi:hypothetical protein